MASTFYSKGTIKVKNADGVSVPFMPNTDTSNVVNTAVGLTLNQTIANLNTRISEAAHKGGIKVMYEEPDDENTSDFNIKTLIGYIDPYIKAEPNEWYITVKTSNKQAAIPFQLYNQAGIELTVDWGDETQSVLTSADYTESGTDESSIHTYDHDGVYTIKIVSSDWSNTSIATATYIYSTTLTYGTSSESSYINNTYYKFLNIFRNTLYQVNSEIPFFSGMNYKSSSSGAWYKYTNSFMGIFSQCSKLSYIPASLFKYNKTKTTFNACFYGCSSLKEIPEHLLDGCTEAKYLDYLFCSCSNVAVVPEHLFDSCTKAVYFDSAFAGTKITEIPAALFAFNTQANAFSKAFRSTKITSIPAHLFDNTKAEYFVQTFYGTKITSIPSGLFNHRGQRFDSCFAYTNITSIPTRLFEDCSTLNVLWNVFEGCSKLTSIPEQLIVNCPQLGTFDYAFYKCTSLVSIPEDLFSECSAVDRLSYMFSGCTSLASIPEHLLDNTVTSYLNGNTVMCDRMFSGCTSLASIPEHLFDNMIVSDGNRSRINCSYMFHGCSSLASIPENLFKPLGSKLNNLQYCFTNCSSLASIPEDLFTYSTSVTNLTYCLYGCSELNGFSIHIGSTGITSCGNFVTKKENAVRTVYVPSGSTTETTFNNVASSLGLTIIGE